MTESTEKKTVVEHPLDSTLLALLLVVDKSVFAKFVTLLSISRAMK